MTLGEKKYETMDAIYFRGASYSRGLHISSYLSEGARLAQSPTQFRGQCSIAHYYYNPCGPRLFSRADIPRFNPMAPRNRYRYYSRVDVGRGPYLANTKAIFKNMETIIAPNKVVQAIGDKSPQPDP